MKIINRNGNSIETVIHGTRVAIMIKHPGGIPEIMELSASQAMILATNIKDLGCLALQFERKFKGCQSPAGCPPESKGDCSICLKCE